jgi:hypothetical protein
VGYLKAFVVVVLMIVGGCEIDAGIDNVYPVQADG